MLFKEAEKNKQNQVSKILVELSLLCKVAESRTQFFTSISFLSSKICTKSFQEMLREGKNLT